MWRNQIFFNEDLLAVVSPVLITPLPANIFPNILAANVPNNILRNPPFCAFASFLIVSLTPFNNNPESSKDLTFFKTSCISSFVITKFVLWPDPKIFYVFQHLQLLLLLLILMEVKHY